MKSNWSWLIVALFAVIIIVQMQCNNRKPKPSVVHLPPVIDTVWIDTSKIIHDTPQQLTERSTPVPDKYRTSDDCNTLKLQFNELKADHFIQRTYFNTYTHMGSSIDIADTIKNGKQSGRGITWNLHYPTVTKTITNEITLPPRRKVFAGGEIAAPFKLDGLRVGVGILYENRRENIVGFAVHTDNYGKLDGELKLYFKLGKR